MQATTPSKNDFSQKEGHWFLLLCLKKINKAFVPILEIKIAFVSQLG